MLPPITGFWGKAHLDPLTREVDGWHPLADHCLDVAAAFRALCEIPGIRRALFAAAGQQLQPSQIDRLCVFALLHDIGKFNRGFQGKLLPGAHRVGHVNETAGFFALGDVAGQALQLDTMATWFTGEEDAALRLLIAAISHHGTPVRQVNLFEGRLPTTCAKHWRAGDNLDPLGGVSDLAALGRIALPAAFDHGPRLDATPALQHRFAGLVMLSDWIASDTRYFKYRASESEDRVAKARDFAKLALRSVGLCEQGARADIARRAPSFDKVFGRAPYPFQSLLAEELRPNEDARLVIAESDTGSGKTEAALAWFLRLFRQGAVDGLYFALPTRVAARELYGRVGKAIRAAFPDEAARLGPVLLAVPGYARTDQDGLLAPAEGNQWPDDARDALRDRAWVAENPKRFLAAPVAVGTIDQALLSVLQVRHAHLRSVCLDRHLLVVDEVHASDAYMRETLRALLAHHLRVGGWALLLSATLGEAARAQFLNREPLPLAQAQSLAYPVVTTRVATIPVPPVDGREKTVRVDFLEALEDLPTVVNVFAEALDAGARVLAVMNTVGRAVALLRAAEDSGRIPREHLFAVAGLHCPHHGRFARADREVLDAAVTNRYGLGTPAGPVLLIGTQTLEQSLDIDADLLVTDHCPMDVLLQRIGRLHRHRRENRPVGYERAHCVVLSPAGNNFEQYIRGTGEHRGAGTGPAGLGTVYDDLRVLKLTREVLAASPEIVIPRDNRQLVEAATHTDALAEFCHGDWMLHAQYLCGEVIAQARLAELSVIEEQPFGEFHFQVLGARIATRLGLNDRIAKLPRPVQTPFNQTITELAIPGHLSPAGDAVDATEVEHEAEGFRFALGDKSYRYTRFGLELITDE